MRCCVSAAGAGTVDELLIMAIPHAIFTGRVAEASADTSELAERCQPHWELVCQEAAGDKNCMSFFCNYCFGEESPRSLAALWSNGYGLPSRSHRRFGAIVSNPIISTSPDPNNLR